MTTMGLRGGLAGVFLVSAGFVGTYDPLAASTPPPMHTAVPDLANPGSVPSAGFLQQLLARSCETSLAAQRRDSRSAIQRRQECGRRDLASNGD